MSYNLVISRSLLFSPKLCRAKRVKYNTEHGIMSISISKAIHDLTKELTAKAVGEAKGEYKTKGDIPRTELKQIVHEGVINRQ